MEDKSDRQSMSTYSIYGKINFIFKVKNPNFQKWQCMAYKKKGQTDKQTHEQYNY